MEQGDRKMFAPVWRGEVRSPEGQVCAALRECHGATAAGLADKLLRSGLALGVKASVTKRVTELLEDLERAGRVERIPDGRFRMVKPAHS
jgi:hypothetical protein